MYRLAHQLKSLMLVYTVRNLNRMHNTLRSCDPPSPPLGMYCIYFIPTDTIVGIYSFLAFFGLLPSGTWWGIKKDNFWNEYTYSSILAIVIGGT